MRATSLIVELDFETAVEAGSRIEDCKHKTKGWAIANSIIYCNALKLKAEVVTGDEHFRKLEDVFLVKP